MKVQFNSIDLHIELQGEPCEMTVEQMAEWFRSHIEGLSSSYEGSISVDIVDVERFTRNIGTNEI